MRRVFLQGHEPGDTYTHVLYHTHTNTQGKWAFFAELGNAIVIFRVAFFRLGVCAVISCCLVD